MRPPCSRSTPGRAEGARPRRAEEVSIAPRAMDPTPERNAHAGPRASHTPARSDPRKRGPSSFAPACGSKAPVPQQRLHIGGLRQGRRLRHGGPLHGGAKLGAGADRSGPGRRIHMSGPCVPSRSSLRRPCPGRVAKLPSLAASRRLHPSAPDATHSARLDQCFPSAGAASARSRRRRSRLWPPAGPSARRARRP